MTYDPILAAMIRRTIAIAKVEGARRMLRTSDYSKACEAAKVATHAQMKREISE